MPGAVMRGFGIVKGATKRALQFLKLHFELLSGNDKGTNDAAFLRNRAATQKNRDKDRTDTGRCRLATVYFNRTTHQVIHSHRSMSSVLFPSLFLFCVVVLFIQNGPN